MKYLVSNIIFVGLFCASVINLKVVKSKDLKMISLVFLVFRPFCDSDLKYPRSDSQYTKVVMSWFSVVTSKIEILCDTNLFSDMIFFLLIPQMTVSNAFSLINLYYITLKNLDPGSRADLG